MNAPLNSAALDTLFRQARTHSVWTDKAVTEDTLRQVYDLACLGATSANCQPGRFVFIRTPEAKERLKPCLAPGNLDKTMTAPVTVLIGHDMAFYENLPRLFPHTDARAWFVGQDTLISDTAFRNGGLQGAYLMLAARALGLDCGPMSGFDADKAEVAFFPQGGIKANFLCNLGYGKGGDTLHPRLPRLTFEEACQVA
ncbi:MAG: malonic semialdehyde reductase [Alphaproteobacteria bacterium]|nr:MAG: malonic semialdehyde reductase [Alphaproteobacteria bacterium]